MRDEITVESGYEYLLRGAPGRETSKGNLLVSAYKEGRMTPEEIREQAQRIEKIAGEGNCVLLPVPASSQKRYLQSGKRFSAQICSLVPDVCDGTGLVRYRFDRSPSHETAYRGEYCLSHVDLEGDIAGHRFILFDDVVTTGNTMSLLRKRVESLGGEVIACLAISRADLYDDNINNEDIMDQMNFKNDDQLKEQFRGNLDTLQEYVDLGDVSEDMFRSGFCLQSMDNAEDIRLAARKEDIDKVIHAIGNSSNHNPADIMRDAISYPLFSWLDGYRDSRVNMLCRAVIPSDDPTKPDRYQYFHIRAEREVPADRKERLQKVDRLKMLNERAAVRLISRNWNKDKVTYANWAGLNASSLWESVPSFVSSTPLRSKELSEAKLDHLAYSFSLTFGLPENIKVVNTTDEMRSLLGKVSAACVGRYEAASDQVFLNRQAIMNSPIEDKIEYASRVLMHECCGHYGLRRLLGKRFETIMQKIYDHATNDLQAEIRHREQFLMGVKDLSGKPLHSPSLYMNPASGKFLPSAEWKTLVVEEFLSYALENRPDIVNNKLGRGNKAADRDDFISSWLYLQNDPGRFGRMVKPLLRALNQFCRCFVQFWTKLKLHIPYTTINASDVERLLRMSAGKVVSQRITPSRWNLKLRFFDHHTNTQATETLRQTGRLQQGPSLRSGIGRTLSTVNRFLVKHNKTRWVVGNAAVFGLMITTPSVLKANIGGMLILAGISYESYRLVSNVIGHYFGGKADPRPEAYPQAKYMNANEKSAATEHAMESASSAQSSSRKEQLQQQTKEFREWFGTPWEGGSVICGWQGQPMDCYVKVVGSDLSADIHSAVKLDSLDKMPRFVCDNTMPSDSSRAAARAGEGSPKFYINLTNPYFMTELTRRRAVSNTDNPMVLLCNLSQEFPDVAARMEIKDKNGNEVDVRDFNQRYNEILRNLTVRSIEFNGDTNKSVILSQDNGANPGKIQEIATYPVNWQDSEIKRDATLNLLQAETGVVLDKSSEEYMKEAPGLIDAIRQRGYDGIVMTESSDRDAEIVVFSPDQVKQAGVLENPAFINQGKDTVIVLDNYCNERDITLAIGELKKAGVKWDTPEIAKSLAYGNPFAAVTKEGKELQCVPQKTTSGDYSILCNPVQKVGGKAKAVERDYQK